MTQIFIAHHPSDAGFVAQLKAALVQAGFRSALSPRRAGAILPIWSAEGMADLAVLQAAGEGAERGILFPVMAQADMLPTAYAGFTTYDLSHWHGAADDFVLNALIDALPAPAVPASAPVSAHGMAASPLAPWEQSGGGWSASRPRSPEASSFARASHSGRGAGGVARPALRAGLFVAVFLGLAGAGAVFYQFFKTGESVTAAVPGDQRSLDAPAREVAAAAVHAAAAQPPRAFSDLPAPRDARKDPLPSDPLSDENFVLIADQDTAALVDEGSAEGAEEDVDGPMESVAEAAPPAPAFILPVLPKRVPAAIQAAAAGEPESDTVLPVRPVRYEGQAAALERFQDCPDCPEMVALPGGRFEMGSPPSEQGRYSYEGPRHGVTLTAFAMGRMEITHGQWAVCVREGPCRTKPDAPKNTPVLFVSWEEAQAYTDWLSEKTGKPYRLPTEAEWEYAARGGTDTAYWWGDDFSRRQVPRGAVTEVGGLAPNPFGLYDTLGNAREWVADCYRSSYRGAPDDGSAVDGNCSRRVVRGGYWDSEPRDVRAANRARLRPGQRVRYMSLRVAMDM